MKLIGIDQNSYGSEAEVKFAVDNQELIDIVRSQNNHNGKIEFRAVEKDEQENPCKALQALAIGFKNLANSLRTKGYKVIFNPPATILITPDGKKYVSKAHNEEFDEEKGLLMCLAKANGFTHLNIKKMIKNANRPNSKKEG